jgi:hypothetical protein
MVTSALVTLPREARDAGWRLWEALKLAPELQIKAMFWAAFDDDDWRIYLATPLAATEGPRKVYTLLREIVKDIPDSELNGLDLNDVVVVNPQERLVKEIQGRYSHVEGDRKSVRRISLSPDEAYVYYIA